MSAWLPAAREVVENKQAQDVDGVLLDLFSASTVLSVHDRLSPANAERLAAMPLIQAVLMAHRVIDRATEKAAS